MRNSMLGSIPIIAFVISTSAWSAADDPPAATSASPAPPKSAAGASSAPPRSSASPSPSTSAAAPASSALSPAASDEPPAPKPLTGPFTGPLPPAEAALPPLPSSVPADYDAPPPPPALKATRRGEWGVQFRLEGAPLGDDAASNAGMGGIGFSLRPRPSPHFAIDFGLDFIGGRDFSGDRRSESAFYVNPMIFLNPRNKVQVYLFAGLGAGGARVERANGIVRNYRYIGADAGAGLEFRFWQRFAFSGDVLAFVRDRSDLQRGAEYVDATTGRYTNSSAGALFRVGATYYW